MATNRIPHSWTIAKLGDVCETTSGGTPSRKQLDYFQGNIPWLKSGELNNNAIYQSEEFINEEAVKNSSAKIFPKGSLLVALYGATVGKLGILGIEAASNQAICAIFESKVLVTKFLFYFLFFKRPTLLEERIGGAQPNISQLVIRNLSLVIPPLPEQYRIVSKLEELFNQLDSAVAALKKAKEQVKVYKQSVLAAAFCGKLTIDNAQLKINEETGLPEGWKWVKLEDLAIDKIGLRRGPFGSAIKKEFFVENGYKVYEQGNAINDDPYRGKYYIDEQKFQELKNFQVQPHDLIVSCSGVTLGRISEIPEDAKTGIINQALLRIRLKNESISNKYFIMYFRSATFQNKIFSQSQGSAMPNLVGISDFKKIELILPPYRDQKRIVIEIETRFSQAEYMEKTIDLSLQQAESLQQSILKKAFEGRLVPQDPSDEPAEKLLERIKKEKATKIKDR